MRYLIENEYNNFGVWEADSEEDALDLLAQSEGYANFAEVMAEQPDLKFVVSTL
jgi:hypothetical protein